MKITADWTLCGLHTALEKGYNDSHNNFLPMFTKLRTFDRCYLIGYRGRA